ncbi:MAG TPA: hypothetical protein VGB85_01325, partial [Nannocystis sp.]
MIEAGAYAEGVVELERAYALLPDPLVHRAGRSKVLGSIRSVLVRLHGATGDPAHLERLRDHLLLYLEGLLLALGEQATADDAVGALTVLREVSGKLAKQRPSPPPEPTVIAVRPVRVRPRVAMAPQKVEGPRLASGPPASTSGRPLRFAGAVLI